MRIAVNTRLLLHDRLDGMGWFTFETMKRITRGHPEHEFIFFFDRPFSEEFIFSDNISPSILFPPARHPFLYYLWFEHAVPAALRKVKADLFFSPDGFLSLTASVPSVAVIHDINFHHRPEDLPFWTCRYYRYFFPRFARKAARIITVSNYSKQDIVTSYHISQEKISVAYNGANTLFTPLSEAEKVFTREKFSGGSDFFVFVGNLHPRKNVPGMLRAFDLFRGSVGREFKMLIVGEEMFLTAPIRQTIKGMTYLSDVIFTGRLSPEELRQVYGASVALVFVPFFEGFGIPVVEAMNCETAILASSLTSVPEAGGDAVCYADPHDTASIVEGMKKIACDDSYRNQLIMAGREQRKKFSWDHTAHHLWQVIDEVLRESYR
jgi:glycosyltransferase involved in cell wall biosynthesis